VRIARWKIFSIGGATMTVRELIEILQQLDPDRRILFRDTAGGNRAFASIEEALDTYYVIHNRKRNDKD
jgi:hypothetical protein